MGSFAPIFAALDESGARYVVVGGLAVVLHGYARLTADMKRAAGRPTDQDDIAALEAILARRGDA